MRQVECEYDELITDEDMVKNIKNHARDSYAKHIKKLMHKYSDEKENNE